MNGGNLHGLDVFLKGTNERSEPDEIYWETHGLPNDRCDMAYAPRPYHLERGTKKGPNDGDTECSWCLINWFDRKLASWQEGKVLDPNNGTIVGLQTYLRTIENAGRRCQSHDWDRIFRKNIWEYQNRDELPDDFEPKKGSHHSGLPYYSVYDKKVDRSSRSGRTGYRRPSSSRYEDDKYYTDEEYDVEDELEEGDDIAPTLRKQDYEM